MKRQPAIEGLREVIATFLHGHSSFAEFERSYVNFFADNAADDEFNDSDAALYTALFERLQWTDRKPSQLDRAAGFSSEESTVSWIKDHFPDLGRSGSVGW